jgi:hypothetical protein
MTPRFKVSAKEDRTADGIVFDSKGEMNRYLDLKLAEKAGVIRDLLLQCDFVVSINDKHFCTYTADFSYIDVIADKIIYEDVKSTGTAKDAAYRLRKKAAELYYGVKITEFLVGWKPKKKKKWIRPPRQVI